MRVLMLVMPVMVRMVVAAVFGVEMRRRLTLLSPMRLLFTHFQVPFLEVLPMASPPWHTSRYRDNDSLWRTRQSPYGESDMMPDEPRDIFTERLKTARNLRDLSQTQLADEAKLPQSSVSHFEAGDRKPSFDNLRRLATALNVTTDYLLGRADSPDASGTAARIHRDMHKLSSHDLKLTEDFVELLLQRGGKKGGEQ